VLLEAMVALAILGIAGAAAAWSVAETMSALSRAQARESEVRTASRLARAVSLWSRSDLDRHLGATAQGELVLLVERPTAHLYSVAVVQRSGRPVLRTTLYRDEDPR
jgi:type II secretory pathway pseudopilin PulG